MIALGKSLFLVVEQAMNKIVNLKSHFGELGCHFVILSVTLTFQSKVLFFFVYHV